MSDDSAFRKAWTKKEADGYQYGRDALEQVRLGWDMAESENARLRAERDAARKSALWLTELHTQAATEANERGATIDRLRSQLSALREAAREAWAAYYVACDARLENTGIKPAEELLGKRMRALSAAARTIDAALASTEPKGEGKG